MTPSPVEQRLRQFCLALALVSGIGALIELWLVDHSGSPLQLLPFALSAVVLGSVALVWRRGTQRIVRVHRLLMLLVLAGSAYGVYAHLSYNMTFAREIRRSAPARDIWVAGLRGANPPLAAGVLAMAAALGLMGTYGLVAHDQGRSSRR